MRPCPICGASVDGSVETFPFCTARCRLLDLGNWLDQRYTVKPDSDDPEPAAARDDDE